MCRVSVSLAALACKVIDLKQITLVTTTIYMHGGRGHVTKENKTSGFELRWQILREPFLLVLEGEKSSFSQHCLRVTWPCGSTSALSDTVSEE